MPDAEGLIAEYVARREVGFPMDRWWGPKWCDTPMHCVHYLFRQGREHKYAYGEETLRACSSPRASSTWSAEAMTRRATPRIT